MTFRTDPGGSVSLTGRRIEVDGSIVTPGGRISLESHLTLPALAASEYGIDVGAGGHLLTRGLWTNDIVGTSPSAGIGAIAIKGGSVSLVSTTDVVLQRGSVVDVSGGARWTAAGRLNAGDAGSITLSSGRFLLGDGEAARSTLVLAGQLRGYSAAKGGTLSLSTSFVSIGGTASGRVGELHLTSADFAAGGFSRYDIAGQDGMVVAAGTTVQPAPRTWIFAADAATRPTGIDPAAAVAAYRALPWELRSAPTSLSLSANSIRFGNITLGAGSTLAVDPGGTITVNAGRNLTVLGRIEARAGTIDLSTALPSDAVGYTAGQSIWFGSDSIVDARGIARVQPNAGGLRVGEILDGGTIRVRAERGSVVTLAGSRMDVSGVSDSLDIKQASLTGGFFQRTAIAGSAGSITLASLEGMLLDGDLRTQQSGTSPRERTSSFVLRQL